MACPEIQVVILKCSVQRQQVFSLQRYLDVRVRKIVQVYGAICNASISPVIFERQVVDIDHASLY